MNRVVPSARSLPRRRLPFFLSFFLSLSLFSLVLPHVTYLSEVTLPTPVEHYESDDPELAGLAIFSAILPQLEPDVRSRVLTLMQAPDAVEPEAISGAEILAALESLDWKKWRPEIAELFLRQSRVLEVIPESAEGWVPLVHDSLLLFLDRLGEERFIPLCRCRVPA